MAIAPITPTIFGDKWLRGLGLEDKMAGFRQSS
jgi:hypothetical protein